MSNFNLPDNDILGITVTAQAGADAAGNPGVFAGPLKYSVDNTSVVSIAPSVDGTSVSVVRTGTTGVATITVTDDVVSATFTVTIVPSEALSIDFAATPNTTSGTTA